MTPTLMPYLRGSSGIATAVCSITEDRYCLSVRMTGLKVDVSSAWR